MVEVAKLVSKLNPGKDMSFEAYLDGEDCVLFMTGKVEGRSVKFPFGWKYSQKEGGTVVGPKFTFYYSKNWKYKLNIL